MYYDLAFYDNNIFVVRKGNNRTPYYSDLYLNLYRLNINFDNY